MSSHQQQTQKRLLPVALYNLGCRVNRSELDSIATELEARGCTLVDQHDAEVIVVNTCSVTGEAETKTRKALRHLAGLEQMPIVIATGCSASLLGDKLLELAPTILVCPQKSRVAALVLEELGAPEHGVSDMGQLIAAPTPTGRTRPGIKIQDGCDNRCSFCIVWKARGAGRSVDPQHIVSEIKAAYQRGAHEVVFTGINLGSYHYGAMRLPQPLK